MKKSRFIRGLTLLVFLFFITAFVLYRSGNFDEYLLPAKARIQTSPNGGSISVSPTDSVPRAAKDSTPRVMLPSSKSAMVFDRRSYQKDTAGLKKKPDSVSMRQQRLMMSSSKFGPVFTPLMLRVDSVKLDSSKKNK